MWFVQKPVKVTYIWIDDVYMQMVIQLIVRNRRRWLDIGCFVGSHANQFNVFSKPVFACKAHASAITNDPTSWAYAAFRFAGVVNEADVSQNKRDSFDIHQKRVA